MKKRQLLGFLGAAALAVVGLASCGEAAATSKTQAATSTPAASTPAETSTEEEVVTSTNPESRMTRDAFLDKIDTLAAANTAARAAMTTYRTSRSTQVGGQQLADNANLDLPITNGKITVLGKEFNILATKASFVADYLDGATEYENEVYGLVASGNYQFNITFKKADGTKYQFIGGITPQGTFYGGRYYSIDSNDKKTTMWWLAPSAA